MNLIAPTDYLSVFKTTTRTQWDWLTPLAIIGLSLFGIAFIYSAPTSEPPTPITRPIESCWPI